MIEAGKKYCSVCRKEHSECECSLKNTPSVTPKEREKWTVEESSWPNTWILKDGHGGHLASFNNPQEPNLIRTAHNATLGITDALEEKKELQRQLDEHVKHCEQCAGPDDGCEEGQERILGLPEAHKASVEVPGQNTLSENPFPEPSSNCVICDKEITGYDSYGVGAQPGRRYHWSCIRAEAATVSSPVTSVESPDTKRLDWLEDRDEVSVTDRAKVWFEAGRLYSLTVREEIDKAMAVPPLSQTPVAPETKILEEKEAASDSVNCQTQNALKAELARRGLDVDACIAKIEATVLRHLREHPLPCFFPSCASRFCRPNEASTVKVEELGGGFVAECEVCCSGTGTFATRDEAIDEWNQVAGAVLKGTSVSDRGREHAGRVSSQDSAPSLASPESLERDKTDL